jgi:hypothetical protein
VVIFPAAEEECVRGTVADYLAEVVDAERLVSAEAAHLPVVDQERLAFRGADDVSVAVDRACFAEGPA